MMIATPVNVSAYQWREVTAIAVFFALTVLPVSLAARFAEARRPGFLWSALAVLLNGIVVPFVLASMGATATGLIVSFLAMCTIYALVLRTSLLGGIGIAMMVFFLQVVFWVGLASFMNMHLPGVSH